MVRRLFLSTALLTVAVFLAGCDKSGEGGQSGSAPPEPCPPLTVTIGGQPATFVHGFGTSVLDMLGGGYKVVLTQAQPATCDEYYAANINQAPDPLVSAVAGNEGGRNKVWFNELVNVPAETRIQVQPNAVGDPIAICVTAPVELNWSGSTVSVQGLLEGTYCGETR